jgi:hypothetical protein
LYLSEAVPLWQTFRFAQVLTFNSISIHELFLIGVPYPCGWDRSLAVLKPEC